MYTIVYTNIDNLEINASEKEFRIKLIEKKIKYYLLIEHTILSNT